LALRVFAQRQGFLSKLPFNDADEMLGDSKRSIIHLAQMVAGGHDGAKPYRQIYRYRVMQLLGQVVEDFEALRRI